jgi:hypothetical protein
MNEDGARPLQGQIDDDQGPPFRPARQERLLIIRLAPAFARGSPSHGEATRRGQRLEILIIGAPQPGERPLA